MMPRGNELLLPVNPVFIWFSLFFAAALTMAPWGRMAALPDFLAVALVGVGAAFVMGLIVDVHQGALLGQHALAYTLLSFSAITVHRRLLWFTVGSQAVQIVPLFVAAHAVSLLVRMMAGSGFPGWGLVVAPLLESLLWPVTSFVLLAPQRRAPDRDKNRPL
jgi:rod shape-determining protein MreD